MNGSDLIYDEYELPVHRKKRILSSLDDIDEMEAPILITSAKKEDKKDEPVEEPSSWISSLSVSSNTKMRTTKSAKDIFGIKKKKKKKKDKTELKDYNKEFEPEVALLNNLLQDQNRFASSLQQKYDKMEALKSTARGTGKFTTDLIDGINQARQLSMQLVDKKIATKKAIADLEIKQKKEMGLGADTDDMNNFAANYLKNIISSKQNMSTNYGGYEIEDMDDEGILMALDESVEDTRGDEVDAYLKYENRGVEIIAIINPDDLDDYEFIAQASDGEVLLDYPLPDHNKLSLNRSTMTATDDTYGRKYRAEFRE